MAEDDINFEYIVKRGLKVLHESTTWTEQFLCGLCCFFLMTPGWSAYFTWFLYFMLANICTFFRDELDIPPEGWKEKCTLKKLRVIIEAFIKKNFGFSLDDFEEWVYSFINDLLSVDEVVVVTDDEGLEVENVVAGDNVVPLEDQLSEEACGREDPLEVQLEQNRMDIKDFKTIVSRLLLDRDSKTAQVIHLEILLAESKDLETQLMAKLSSRKAKCNELEDSLTTALESKKDLEEQVDQLKESLEFERETTEKMRKILQDDNSDIRNELHTKVIEPDYVAEHHMLENIKSSESLEIEKNELFAKLSIANGKIERLSARSTEFEEHYELSQAELYKTMDQYLKLSSDYELHRAESNQKIKQLETEKKSLLSSLYSTDANAKYARRLLFECERERKRLKAKLFETIQGHKLEEAKLVETIGGLDTEKNELLVKLSTALAEVEHFQTLSYYYQKANAIFEAETDQLISRLRNAKESGELHHNKPVHEYQFI